MPDIALAVGCAIGCSGSALALARLGFRQLGEPSGRIGWIVAAAIGAGGGLAAVVVEQRVPDDSCWIVLSALVMWAATLGATAGCDVAAKRIPTGLTRTGAALTLVLLFTAASIADDWRRLAIAVVAGGGCYVALVSARVGRGDTRLGFLGGLGLGAVGIRGAIVGAASLCVVLLVQVTVTMIRGGDRHSRIAFGPALAVGFIVAAAGS